MLNSTIAALIVATSAAYAEESSGPELIASSAKHSMEEFDMVESEIRSEYFKFVAEYGKQYASKEHMDERFTIFKENHTKI